MDSSGAGVKIAWRRQGNDGRGGGIRTYYFFRICWHFFKFWDFMVSFLDFNTPMWYSSGSIRKEWKT